MPAIKNVTSGSVTYTSGSGTDPTDIEVGTSTNFPLGQSVICFTEQNADTSGRRLRHCFSAQLLTNGSNTDLSFSRDTATSATTVILEWTVYAFESSTLAQDVISGEIDATNLAEAVALGSVVDEAATLVFVSSKTSSLPWVKEPQFTTELTTNVSPRDEITFTHGATPSSGESVIRYQVVEFQTADILVSHGLTSYGKTGTTTALSGHTTLGDMFVLSTGIRGGNTTSVRFFTRVQLNSVSELGFNPQNFGSSVTGYMSWSVAELLDGGAVEQGVIAITDTNATPATQPSFTALASNRTGVIVGTFLQNAYVTENSDATFEDIFCTIVLDAGRDGVTITRTGTDKDIEVGWAVVEWAAAAVAGAAVWPSPTKQVSHLINR